MPTKEPSSSGVGSVRTRLRITLKNRKDGTLLILERQRKVYFFQNDIVTHRRGEPEKDWPIDEWILKKVDVVQTSDFLE